MRDVYQDIFARYPTLEVFDNVAADEVAMIAALKKAFAKHRIAVPGDTGVVAAQDVVNTITCISMAQTIAVNLERSTAAMMAKLLQTTRSSDVAKVVALIKTTSLGSHVAAFVAEQTGVSAPAPAPTTPTQHVVPFTPNQTVNVFLALLRDESVDAIELDGTYHLPYTVINIDRTRPVVVRPAEGATVILSGTNIWTDPQFGFGFGGPAGNITMQGLIFDGFLLGQQGIICALDCHDITLNDMVVRNSRADARYSQPFQSWAVYLSSTSTVHTTNFTANRWTVDGSARQMGAFQVYGGDHITATDWTVSNACYAVYASSIRGQLTDFVLDGWTISNTGAPAWKTANASVYVENASGRFSNMHTTSSGALVNVGNPKLIDGGGNSL